MKAFEDPSNHRQEGDSDSSKIRRGRNDQETVDGGGDTSTPIRNVERVDAAEKPKERGLRGRRFSHRKSLPNMPLRQVLLRTQRSQPLSGADKEAKRQAYNMPRTRVTAGSVRQDLTEHRKNLSSRRTHRSQDLTGAEKEAKRRGSQPQPTAQNNTTIRSASRGPTKNQKRQSKRALFSRRHKHGRTCENRLVDGATSDCHETQGNGNNSEGGPSHPVLRQIQTSVPQSSPARVSLGTDRVSQQTVHNVMPVLAIPTPWPSDNVLEATPIRDDTPSEIGEAQLVPSEELERKVIRAEKARECRRIGYGIIMICIIVTTSVVVFGRNDTSPVTSSPVYTTIPTLSPTGIPTASPSQGPSFHIEDIRDISVTQLQEVSSPQAQAHQWLSNHTNITNMPQWRRAQLFALATFYYTYAGPNWRDDVNGHWMKDTIPECDWFSLEFGTFFPISGKYSEVENASRASICDPSGRYTVLWPPKNLWVDPRPFPQEMTLLSALKKIDIVNSPISSSVTQIENVLEKMSNLEHLTLDFASLVGTIPTSIASSFTKLSHLSLVANAITGTIPPQIGNMQHLKTLKLSTNKIHGQIPSTIQNLTKLEEIRLAYNFLSSTLPRFPPLLKRIYMMSSHIGGPIPSELFDLGQLSILRMQTNVFSGSIPTEVGLGTLLQYIDFSGNALTNTLPTELGQLSSQLVFLDASYNSLTGTLPRELGSIRNLNRLNLQGNALSQALPTEIASLPTLQYVDLSSNRLSGIIPTEFGLLVTMQLNLSFNSLVGSLPTELGALPESCRISLKGNAKLEGSIPWELCPKFCSDQLTVDCDKIQCTSCVC